MYFRDFPTIVYRFNDRYIHMRDIVRNVRFRNILDSITLWESYLWQDGDTLEIISEKLYGSPDYFFIICLANDIIDYRKDVPLTHSALQEYIAEKYPIHLYYNSVFSLDINDLIVIDLGTVDVAWENFLKIEPNTGLTEENLIFRCNNNSEGPYVLRMITHTYPLHSCFDLSKRIRHYELNGIYYTPDFTGTSVGKRFEGRMNDNENTPVDAVPVTNEQWEDRQNEAKRTLRIPHPNHVPFILSEFKRLV